MAKQKITKQQPLPKAKPNAATEKIVYAPWTAFPSSLLHYILAIAAVIFSLLIYSNTFSNGYVLDDVGAITNNHFVKEGWIGIPKLFDIEFWHFDNMKLGYYRPLALVTFAMEWGIFGDNPQVSHTNNVIIYAGTIFLLFWVCYKGFTNGNVWYAFFATLIFALHPIHTEVVANLKSRDEIMSFGGILLAALFYIWYRERNEAREKILLPALYVLLICVIAFVFKLDFGTRGRTWTVIFCAFAGAMPFIFKTKPSYVFALISLYFAAMAKESSMSATLLLPLIVWRRDNTSNIFELIKSWLPFLGVILVFFIHKNMALGYINPKELPWDIVNYPYRFLGAKFLSTFTILFYCIWKVTIPYPQSYDYSYNQIPIGAFDNPTTWAGLILAGGIIYFSWKAFFGKKFDYIGLLILVVGLLPNMLFVITRGGIFAERFLYVPALGFALLLVQGLFWINEKYVLKHAEEHAEDIFSIKQLVVPCIALLPILGFFSYRTWIRNDIWKSDATLFSSDIRFSPQSCHVNKHLGSEVINQAFRLMDSLNKKQYTKDGFKKDSNRLKELCDFGLHHTRRAMEIHPKFGEAIFKMGYFYQAVRPNIDSAVFYYRKSIAATPTYYFNYGNIGIIYESIGKPDLASWYYNEAVRINPQYKDAYGLRDKLKARTGLDVKTLPVQYTKYIHTLPISGAACD
ncbi:MAG: hypothetical protein IPO14_13755 [Saprospiraceae bacterium]|nr:hypothetical protein [Saprospiraceae bacterium]